jgi:hypothetical protein
LLYGRHGSPGSLSRDTEQMEGEWIYLAPYHSDSNPGFFLLWEIILTRLPVLFFGVKYVLEGCTASLASEVIPSAAPCQDMK